MGKNQASESLIFSNIISFNIFKGHLILNDRYNIPQRFIFRYLAAGNSFRSLAYSFRMGESTVREIVYTTCTAIWTVLKPIVMPVPNQELWIKSEKGFCDKWNFPNAVAAIDGKHVVIQAPLHSGSDYFCYKKHFSTVLALVDPNCKFLFIDVGGYGKN